jgi:hypothetical protein
MLTNHRTIRLYILLLARRKTTPKRNKLQLKWRIVLSVYDDEDFQFLKITSGI